MNTPIEKLLALGIRIQTPQHTGIQLQDAEGINRMNKKIIPNKAINSNKNNDVVIIIDGMDPDSID